MKTNKKLIGLFILTLALIAIFLPACIHEHSFSSWITSDEATCTTAGSEFRSCSSCEYTETRSIPAKGHNEVKISAVSPTCTKEGHTEGSYCSICDEILKEPISIPKIGHENEHGVCTVCFDVLNPFEALAHYILENGRTSYNGDVCMQKTSNKITYTLSTNTDASKIQFMYRDQTSSPTSKTAIIDVNPTGSMHTVSSSLTASSSVGLDIRASCTIDGRYFSSSNRTLSNFNCYKSEGSTYNPSIDFKNAFKSDTGDMVNILLIGIEYLYFPDYITMEMIGFDNY